MAKKVNIKTVKPESDEKVIKKVQKAKTKKEQKQKDEKRAKINRVLDEVKAFLVIDLIVFSVAFIGWYWYTHFYSEERNLQKPTTKEVTEYKRVSFVAEKGQSLQVLNNKYLLLLDSETIYKIMDLKTNILYEGEFRYTNIYEGIDDNLYVVRTEDADYANVITLYKLENGELEETKELSESKTYYFPVRYYNETTKEYKLIGFSAFKNGYDEEMNEFNKTAIYNIKTDEIVELNDRQLYGDSQNLKEDPNEIITFDPRYIIINNLQETNPKYGLYDLEDNRIIITPIYDTLQTNKEDELLAVKNKKYGIVNKSLKKIVNFEYDLLDKHENFYVVGKDSKLAIMDNDYKLITKFIFPYSETKNESINNQDNTEQSNSYKAFQVKDKYILVTNKVENKDELSDTKQLAYIINPNGEYQTIEAHEFHVAPNNSLIYSYNKDTKTYTFYDQDLKEKYNIDISNYDYTKRAIVNLLNESTIEIKLDSEIYYDYKNGEEIPYIKDYSYFNNGIDIIYTNEKEEYSYQTNGHELGKIKASKSILTNKPYINIDDNTFYYLTGKEYIMITKGA